MTCVALVSAESGGSSSALEATRSRFTRSEATSERSRGHSKPLRSALEATSSLFELSRGHLESLLEPSRSHRTRENSRKLAAKPTRELCGLEKTRENRGRRHLGLKSLWSLEMAAPRASGASRWLLPRGSGRRTSRRNFEALRRRLAQKHSLGLGWRRAAGQVID